MKLEVTYPKYVTEMFEVPKKFEFAWLKDEEDYTDEEWDILASSEFENFLPDDAEVESIYD